MSSAAVAATTRSAGEGGDDRLKGGNGADLLDGGDGGDGLAGGKGRDVFRFADTPDPRRPDRDQGLPLRPRQDRARSRCLRRPAGRPARCGHVPVRTGEGRRRPHPLRPRHRRAPLRCRRQRRRGRGRHCRSLPATIARRTTTSWWRSVPPSPSNARAMLSGSGHPGSPRLSFSAGVSAATGPGPGGTGSRNDMPGTMQGDWRLFGAGADDRFHFATNQRAAPVGILTEGEASLPADRLIDAMAQLAEDAYDQTFQRRGGRWLACLHGGRARHGGEGFRVGPLHLQGRRLQGDTRSVVGGTGPRAVARDRRQDGPDDRLSWHGGPRSTSSRTTSRSTSTTRASSRWSRR